MFGGDLLRWIGVGLLMFSAPPLFGPVLQTPDVIRHWRRWGPAVVFGLVFVVMCGELLLGRPPATRDHGIHYFQTHLWVHDLLPQGRLNGWSFRLNHGYPFGDSYAVLGYVLMASLHVISFGLITLRASYAYGIACLWLGSALSVWWFGRTAAMELFDATSKKAGEETGEEAGKEAGSEIEASKTETPAPDFVGWANWAGMFGATIWMLDPGAARQGGWNYLMFHGVWPQQLSTALWLASVTATLQLWREPTPRRAAVVALAAGASVMAHPFGMLTCAFTAIMIPLVAWITRGRQAWAAGALRSHALAYGVGALISLGTVVVFLASADYMGRGPVPWSPWPELSAELFTGEPFRAHRAVVGPLALLGVVLVLRRGRTAGWLALLGVVGLMLLASQASVTALRLDLLVSAFKNLQFPRYSLAVKPLWYALAGIGLAGLCRLMADARERIGPAVWTRIADPSQARAPSWVRLVACIAVAPWVAGIAEGVRDAVPRPVAALHTLESSHHGPHEAALHEALAAEAEALEGTGQRMRVAFLRQHMSGGTYPLFAIADVDADLAMDSHIPSVNFIYRLDDRDPEALDALGTTHVIHDRPLPLDEGRLEARLEPVGRFGDYALARLLPDPDPKPLPARIVQPELPLRPAADGTVEFEITADQIPEEGRVRVELPVAPYRKWRLFHPDGSPAKLEVRRMFRRSMIGLSFRAKDAGVYRLEYVRPAKERNAAWVSLVAFVLALGALPFGSVIAWRPRLREGPWPARIAAGVTGLAIVGGAVVVPAVQARKLEKTWESVFRDTHRRRRFAPPKGQQVAFVRDLAVARTTKVWTSHRDRCDGMLTKDARAGCSDRAQRPHVEMLYRRPYLYRCIAVTVPAYGEAQLIVEDLGADERVYATAERLTHGAGAKSLSVGTSAADDEVRTLRQPRDLVIGETEHEGVATIDLRNAFEDPQTVCVAMAVGRVQ